MSVLDVIKPGDKTYIVFANGKDSKIIETKVECIIIYEFDIVIKSEITSRKIHFCDGKLIENDMIFASRERAKIALNNYLRRCSNVGIH